MAQVDMQCSHPCVELPFYWRCPGCEKHMKCWPNMKLRNPTKPSASIRFEITLTFPKLSSPWSKKNITPSMVNTTPKNVRPMPISARKNHPMALRKHAVSWIPNPAFIAHAKPDQVQFNRLLVHGEKIEPCFACYCILHMYVLRVEHRFETWEYIQAEYHRCEMKLTARVNRGCSLVRRNQDSKTSTI